MTRTDAHRPSAIVPDEYDVVSCDYYGPSYGGPYPFLVRQREIFRDHMNRTGGRYAERHNSGSCHICGAAAMYVVNWYHRPSNTYIVTGEDCAVKMEMDGGGDLFRSLRKSVAKQRQRRKGEAKAKETLALLGLSDAWRYYDPGYDGPADGSGWGREEPIIQNIVFKLVRYDSLSEKQATLVAKLLADIADRPRRRAEAAAKRAASSWLGTVGERVTLELEVAFTTSFKTQYGTMHVHSMRDAAGNVVIYKGGRIADRGQRIRVKGTVKEHGIYKELKQTIISRPKVEAVL